GVFWLVAVRDTWQLYVLAVLFGATFFTTAPLSSTLVGQLFGAAHHGAIFGMANLFHHLSGGLGSYAGGLAFDLTRSYRGIFLAGGAVALGSAAATSFAPPARRPTRPGLPLRRPPSRRAARRGILGARGLPPDPNPPTRDAARRHRRDRDRRRPRHRPRHRAGLRAGGRRAGRRRSGAGGPGGGGRRGPRAGPAGPGRPRRREPRGPRPPPRPADPGPGRPGPRAGPQP